MANGEKRLRVTDTTPTVVVIITREEDLGGVLMLHQDALVITSTMVKYGVARCLIDKESFANISFEGAFQQLGLEDKDIEGNMPSMGSWVNWSHLGGEFSY